LELLLAAAAVAVAEAALTAPDLLLYTLLYEYDC